MKIKLGGTRFVLVFNTFVIKIPYPLWRRGMYGFLSNIEEAYKWKHNRIWKKNYCPVLFYLPLGLLLVMKKAEPLLPTDDIDIDISCTPDEDVYWGNVGTLNGNQVLIDYGVKPVRRINTFTKFLSKIRYKEILYEYRVRTKDN